MQRTEAQFRLIRNPSFIAWLGLFVLVASAATFLKTNIVSAAQPPTVITYQGKLLVNNLAATTTQSIALTLYDAATGGNALYTASGTLAASSTLSVTPTNGLFSVDLGGTGTNSLSPDIFQNNQSVYLEVRISSQVLTPRKQITASPFAYNAKYLDGVGATSTASSSQYIPVSDSRGNFNFNTVSSTQLFINSGYIFASGTTGGTPGSGAGTRFMWIPSKGALRAGTVNGVQWDDASIGSYSVAFGQNTTSSGGTAFVGGSNSLASGEMSFAFGNGTQAVGLSSIALGTSAFSSGADSFAIGQAANATAQDAIAIGANSTASGAWSLALGLRSTASASSTVAIGTDVTASGVSSTAIGTSLTVSGANSFGISLDGTARTVSQANAFAVVGGNAGFGTVAPGYNLSVSGTAAFGQFTGTGLAITSAAGGSNTVTTTLTLIATSTNPGNGLVFDTNRTITSSTAALYSWRNNGFRLMSLSSSGTLDVFGAISAMTATLGTPGAPGDIAERVDIATDETIEPGDIMMVDPNHPDTYRRAARPHPALSSVEERDNSHIPIAGVVSTNPTIVVGNGKTQKTAVLAMLGRVPVKVSLEAGPIKPGEPLTLGSRPGVAAKATAAGPIIGFALEGISTVTPDNQGKALMLLRPTWWGPGLWFGDQPNQVTPPQGLLASIQYALREIGVIIERGLVNIRRLVAEHITSAEIVTKKICFEEVCVTKSQVRQLLEKNGLLSAPADIAPSETTTTLALPSPETLTGNTTSTADTTVVLEPVTP